MSLKNFFHFSYWFTQPDAAVYGVRAFWIAFFIILLAAGVALLILRAFKSENAVRLVLSRGANALLTLGILGLLWFVFRQQNVAILSMRFWMLVWVVAAVIWFGSVLRYVVLRMPAIKAENREREIREKYLPKANK